MMESYKRFSKNICYFKEDFATKDIQRAVMLIVKVIGKRTGEMVYTSPLVSTFKKSDGNYGGYKATIGKKAIRFNFKLQGGSGKIMSIDIWDSPSKITPTRTVDVSTFPNIIKIIEHIVTIIKNNTVGETEVLEEAKFSPAINASMQAWIRDMDRGEEYLANNRISNMYQKDYLFWWQEYGKDKELKKLGKDSFYKFIKTYLETFGMKNIFVKTIKVTKAGKEVNIYDPKEEKKFNESIFGLTLEDKFQQVRRAIQMVAFPQFKKNATLISGTAGVGKTFQVEKALKDMGIPKVKGKGRLEKPLSSLSYKKITGDIKNPRVLYQLFTDWNDPNLIIVFDDANSVIKNKSNVELMRGATESSPVRNITYTDNVINADNKKYPPELDFKSKIVIITNVPKKKIDNAIVSRTAPIELDVSFEEIADDIKKNLEFIEPTQSTIQFPPPPGGSISSQQMKEEVYNFIVYEGRKAFDVIDYRLFKDCLDWRATNSTLWKKFCYAILKKSTLKHRGL